MSVVIVAGGANGIGRAVALAFASAGSRVLLVDRDERAAAAVAAQAPGDAMRLLIDDLSDPGACARAVDTALAAFGTLDTLFTSAAALVSAPLAQWSLGMWEESMNLNLRMPFLLTQAAAPYLARSQNPSIIFTSSTGALRGHAGMPAYHASKAGLLGLCRSLADELAPSGIRVNCLLPGWIDTAFNNPYWSHQADPQGQRAAVQQAIPAGRQGEPGDVAGAVLFLASPSARYITGTSLVVDGGYTAV
ncbi:3-oxoacyl-[acyl-carrier protein] reductase [Burkholderia sp. D7]|nr:3-oxoacyl-[acyl-carrier protein] reductase [Burkholderia sp. D7]